MKEITDLLNEKIEQGYDHIDFTGKCHDCGKDVTVTIFKTEGSDDVNIGGGALYGTLSEFSMKCDECFEHDRVLHNKQCEVYSRVVGYMRPVSQWNKGKQAEYDMRKEFSNDVIVDAYHNQCGCHQD